MLTRLQAVRCTGLLNAPWSPIDAIPVLAPVTNAVVPFAFVRAPIGSRLGSSEDTPAAAIQAQGPDRHDLLQHAVFQPQPEKLTAHAKIRLAQHDAKFA